MRTKIKKFTKRGLHVVKSRRHAAVALLVALVVAAGCKSDSAPAGPPVPQSIKLTSDTTPLLLGDSITWSASVILSNGTQGTGAITWTSSNTAIMPVSAGGVVTAKGTGSATITATGSGFSANAIIRSYDAIAKPELKVASGAITVTSTSDQIAAGTMTLTRAAGAAPIVAGNVILGTADGGYIRRVTAASGTGATQTLQTVQATVGDAFSEISVDSIFKPNVAAALRAAYLKDRGTDRWPKGMMVAPDGTVSLSNVEMGLPINLAATVTSGPGSATVALNGSMSLDIPEVDVKVKLKLTKPEKNRFRFVPKVQLTANLTPSITFTGNIAQLLQFPSYEKELVKIPLPTVCAGLVLCFKTTVRLIAYATPFANVTGTLSQTVNIDYGLWHLRRCRLLRLRVA
jgi:hypothetical protein